jgi:hypothetical protein
MNAALWIAAASLCITASSLICLALLMVPYSLLVIPKIPPDWAFAGFFPLAAAAFAVSCVLYRKAQIFLKKGRQ